MFSIVGSSHRPAVNQMLLQYFINYNLKKGWYISSSPVVTANWHSQASGEAADGNDTPGGGVWTVPFGGGVGRIMRLGFQPVNITVVKSHDCKQSSQVAAVASFTQLKTKTSPGAPLRSRRPP